MRNTTRAGALGAAALTALLFAIPSAGASDNAVACPGHPAENVEAVAAGAPCGWHAPPPAGGCCDHDEEVTPPEDPPGNDDCGHCTPDETTPPETTPDTTPDVTVEEPPAPTATPAAVPIAAPAPSVVAVPDYTG